jgi:hypothetical protein
MSEPGSELLPRLPLLEKPRADAGLTDDEAAALVVFGATAWSDHWASAALDWVDQGVWSDAVAEALRTTATNTAYSQETRHRAWHKVKPGRQRQ